MELDLEMLERSEKSKAAHFIILPYSLPGVLPMVTCRKTEFVLLSRMLSEVSNGLYVCKVSYV